MLLLTVISVLFVSSAQALTVATCSTDNCLRHMHYSTSIGKALCTSYLGSVTTTTITPVLTVLATQTATVTVGSPAKRAIQARSVTSAPLALPTQCRYSDANAFTSKLSSICSCMSFLPGTSMVTSTIYASAITSTQTIPITYTATTTASPSGCPAIDAQLYGSLPSCSSYGGSFSSGGHSFDVGCDAILNLSDYIGYSQAYKGALSLGSCIARCVGMQDSDNPCYSVNYDVTDPDFDYCWLYPETGSGSGVTDGVCGHAYAVPAGTSPKSTSTTSTTAAAPTLSPTDCSAYDDQHEITPCSSYGPTYSANGKTYSITCDASVISGYWVASFPADKGEMDVAECVRRCANDDNQHSDFPCVSATYDSTNPDYDQCTLYGDAGSGHNTGLCGLAAIVPYVAPVVNCADMTSVYTTPSGVQFAPECDHIHCYSKTYYSPDQPNFGACMDYCATINNCVGVDFTDGQCISFNNVADCGLEGSGPFPVPWVYEGSDTALRINPPPQIPDPVEEG